MKLKNGAKAELTGVVTYTNGVYQVNLGLKQLSGKTGDLVDGVNQLTDGSNQLNTGLGTYTSSVSTLTSGLGQLDSQTSTLSDQVGQMASGSSQVNTGVQTLVSTLKSSTATSYARVLALKSTLTSLKDELGQLSTANGSGETDGVDTATVTKN